MKFHIGSFIVGITASILLHNAVASVLASNEVVIDNVFAAHPELIAEVHEALAPDQQYLKYLQADQRVIAKLEQKFHNRKDDINIKHQPPTGDDYYWTHRGWVERMTCTDSPEFINPVKTTITSRYGHRSNPFTGRSHVHSGVDFRGNEGRPVVAAESGIVSWANRKGHYGKAVVIGHKNGFTTLYGHLTDYAVKLGDRVVKGQTIGYVGRTGRVTGPHLHFEVRCYNVPVNPVVYLNKKGKKALVSVLRRRFPKGESYVSAVKPVVKRYVPHKQQLVNQRKHAKANSSIFEMRSGAF